MYGCPDVLLPNNWIGGELVAHGYSVTAGALDGVLLGALDGVLLGASDGALLGAFDGALVGAFDGALLVAGVYVYVIHAGLLPGS